MGGLLNTDAAGAPNQSACHPLDTFGLAYAGVARTVDDRGGGGRRCTGPTRRCQRTICQAC